MSENPSPTVPNCISPEEVQKIGEEVRESLRRDEWHGLDAGPGPVKLFRSEKPLPLHPNCGEPAPFPDQYLSCCQPKGHVGSHEYPPRPASAVDRFWRCPRCSRTGRFPVMEEESTERLVALVQHARSVHADGDSCSCEFFTFSDTPADPVANQRLGRSMAIGVASSRMCARCTVLFTPTAISAKFCEDCELAATRGGVSRLPKDVVAAAAHLPAELAHSVEEKDATLRVYTDRIAALQKRCDLQSRMHREQVTIIQKLEQKIADLSSRYKDEPEQGSFEEEVIYEQQTVFFWVKWILFFAVIIGAALWIAGVLP